MKPSKRKLPEDLQQDANTNSAAVTKTRGKKATKKAPESEENGEVGNELPSTSKAKKAPSKVKAAKKASEQQEGPDSSTSKAPKRTRKAPASKKNDSENQEEADPSTSKAPKKPRKAPASKKNALKDSENQEEVGPSTSKAPKEAKPLKAPAKAKGKLEQLDKPEPSTTAKSAPSKKKVAAKAPAKAPPKAPAKTKAKAKAPLSKQPGQSERTWCSECLGEWGGAACAAADHASVDWATARRRAQTTLDVLAELEVRFGAKLTMTVRVEKECETFSDSVGVSLSLADRDLTPADRGALSAFLDGMELEPGCEEYLSASSRHSVEPVLRAVFAKLPVRTPGAVLGAGTILLQRRRPNEFMLDLDEAGEAGEAGDVSGALEQLEDGVRVELRVHYDRAVLPHQGRGARVLGRITDNLQLVGRAVPATYYVSGWGPRSDGGGLVRLANVAFVAAQ